MMSLYFDTDSVIYRHKIQEDPIKDGELLGEVSNELKPGSFIQEFVSSGPKAMDIESVTQMGRTFNETVKVKGIKLTIKDEGSH